MLTPDITKNETIIVTGCSYTTQPYNTIQSYEHEEVTINNTWSTYIQCKKMINTAGCGKGNYEMIKHALAYIYANPNEKIDRVIVALSGWQRFYTPQMKFTGYGGFWDDRETVKKHLDAEIFTPAGPKNFRGLRHELVWQYEFGPPNKDDIVKMIKDTFISLNNLYHVCIAKSIKLHVFQMLNPWPFPEKGTDEHHMLLTTSYEEIMELSTLYDIFREKKVDIYGFPFITELGGEWVWHDFYRRNRRHRYTIPGDGHPNEIGHKRLSEKILKNLNDFKL